MSVTLWESFWAVGFVKGRSAVTVLPANGLQVTVSDGDTGRSEEWHPKKLDGDRIVKTVARLSKRRRPLYEDE